MSAYAVFIREQTLDRAELDTYFKEVRATFAGHEVKVLANYGPQEDLEGSPTEGTVVAEFPSWKPPKPGTTAPYTVRCANTASRDQSTQPSWSKECNP